MDIVELINHPERLDRDTLYELRSMLALYPYFQTARLLMLQNLYLLHDPSFDQELRRASIYITDRKVLFQMIEAAHYRLKATPKAEAAGNAKKPSSAERDSRTISLIDDFLDSLPKEEEPTEKKGKRKPTPADAAVDYVAYLLESESEEERQQAAEVPQLIGHSLIDSFINNDNGKIVLCETPTLKPDLEDNIPETQNGVKEGYFTETFARIYIKQGNYSKALEIIQQLSLENPKKNVYFADQIRFLQKLIINNNKNNLQK
ncbi:tetratricopeptide repeat protein [Prevotella sp. E2-28]|uniref:tetratricopeptide repeat protein n=1 Tax=Prevotella sp. E2-28 TaxID=2913620 RepID=UPI001EDB0A98|nr:tetratricopeptide repeat protein [Prevotella sp. E2-28]UKK54602.1 tetratricopeptide repeat protein [Prevotella sp. E2-28]